MYRLILLLLLCPWVYAISLQAQQATPPPDAPAPAQQPSEASGPQNTIQSGIAMALTLQKKSVLFPDLATGKTDLTGWDKCKIAANTSVAPSTVGAALLGSLVGQARGNPPGYGGGFEGYGKRFGADLARSASYNLFGPCLIAASTHEDPRFFVQSQLGLKASLKYAAVRLVFTRNDDGERVINYSGLGGSLAAETLANVYYPKGSRSVGDTMIRFSLDMVTRYAGHMLRQYLPQIDKKLKLSPAPMPK